MTLTILLIIFLNSQLLCLCKFINVQHSRECGESKLIIGHRGILTSPNYPDKYPGKINCCWILNSPHNATTITIVLTKLDIEKDPNCQNNFLSVASKKYCGTKLYPQTIMSASQEAAVEISFVTTTRNAQKKKGFSLIFSVRNTTDCAGYDLSCLDGKGCYDSRDICNLRYECGDHSDEINCANCGKHQTSCNNHSYSCFDPLTERCNGILNCPLGEDELNCSEICPNMIACRNGRGCYTNNQICDKYINCLDLSDELECDKKLCGENYFLCGNGKCISLELVENGRDDCGDSSDESKKPPGLTGFVILAAFTLTTCFIMLICRWCSNRRDINLLMLDLPQFPLPPFRGPEEISRRDCQVQFSESDFLHGGDIYEAFVHARRRLRPIRRQNRCVTTFVVPQGEQRLLTRYRATCATAALASLGIPLDFSQNTRKDIFEKCEKFCEFCHNASSVSIATNASDEQNKLDVVSPPSIRSVESNQIVKLSSNAQKSNLLSEKDKGHVT